MSWTRLAINASLIIVSCIIAILLVEAIYKYSPKSESVYHWNLRYMLFSNPAGGSAYKSFKDFFTYQPNTKIHNKNFYFVNGQWVKEYDYFIPTNNFGLVQTNDIQANVPSVLLLGDSFTEGQGASPWFELFKISYPQRSLQLVNGGMIGTGFQQWRNLHNHLLGEGINVKKLVVIFISNDYVRPVWVFGSSTHDCIADYHQCRGFEENYFGMPANDKLDEYLESLRSFREEQLHKREMPKSLFPGTRLALQFLKDYLEKTRTIDSPEISANREVIRQFIETYKNEVLFVHIPSKDEIFDHAVSPLGKMVRKDIELLGGEYYDGQASCGLTKEDYFVNDGHPNENGYSKISACTIAAVNKKWPLQ